MEPDRGGCKWAPLTAWAPNSIARDTVRSVEEAIVSRSANLSNRPSGFACERRWTEKRMDGRISQVGQLELTLLQEEVAYWQVNGQVHELC